ncbi:hypothetical protein D9M69_607640 [compost metagenome]
MKERIAMWLYICSACNSSISHDCGSASRLVFYASSLITESKRMVGSKLMSHFVGHKVDIEIIANWDCACRKAAAFPRSAYAADTACISVVSNG